ncbi:hypothetical protein BKA80DRAFT_258897, partial [Phyllosticta citrichinensis]
MQRRRPPPPPPPPPPPTTTIDAASVAVSVCISIPLLVLEQTYRPDGRDGPSVDDPGSAAHTDRQIERQTGRQTDHYSTKKRSTTERTRTMETTSPILPCLQLSCPPIHTLTYLPLPFQYPALHHALPCPPATPWVRCENEIRDTRAIAKRVAPVAEL